MTKLSNILKKPIFTEKSLRLAQKGEYTFEVNRKATKRNIAAAIEQLFNVNVVDVRTITVKGKKRRLGRYRQENEQAAKKKAIVMLKEKQTIPLFDMGT